MPVSVVSVSLAMVMIFRAGVLHPEALVKLRVWVPTGIPVIVAPLLWEGLLSMNHLAPEATASAGEMVTLREPLSCGRTYVPVSTVRVFLRDGDGSCRGRFPPECGNETKSMGAEGESGNGRAATLGGAVVDEPSRPGGHGLGREQFHRDSARLRCVDARFRRCWRPSWIMTSFVAGVFHPGMLVKLRECLPTMSSERVAPLVSSRVLSTVHFAPPATAISGESVTVREPGFL